MSTALVPLTDQERSLAVLATEIRNRHRNHLRALQFEAVRDQVIIRGVATSYYGKQLALQETRNRCPLNVLANEVVVQEPGEAARLN